MYIDFSILEEAVKAGNGKFNELGLAYDRTTLLTIIMLIPFWPIDVQSEYADAITTYLCKNNKPFCDRAEPKMTFDDIINSTAVGNLAYVALHYQDEVVRNNHRKHLKDYKTYAIHWLETESYASFSSHLELINEGMDHVINKFEDK